MARRRAKKVLEAAPAVSDRFVGWGTLVVGLAISVLLLYKNGGWQTFRAPYGMSWDEYHLFNITLLLWPPFVYILMVARRELSEFGLTPGDVRGGSLFALIAFALFLPVVCVYAGWDGPQRYYLSWMSESGVVKGLGFNGTAYTGGIIDWGRLAFHELVMGCYMFAWEWFFRGFLLSGLRKIMPTWAAAVVQMIPFFVLHLGKPASEFWSSMAGGLFLAPVAIKYKSFLPCFLVHYLISASNDLAVLFFHFR